MTITATTIYLIVAVLALVVSPLLWRWIRPPVWRYVVIGGIFAACGYATSGAERIANSLNAKPLQAVADEWLQQDTPAAELAREVIELDPDLADDFLRIIESAQSQGDPRDYAFAEGAKLGMRVAGRFGTRLGAATDDSLELIAELLAAATDRLPGAPDNCLALMRGEMVGWVAELNLALPTWGDDLARATTAALREGKGRPNPPAPDAATTKFAEAKLGEWVATISPQELAYLMRVSNQTGAMDWMSGEACGVFTSLFRFIADLPSPDSGRLFRYFLLAMTQQV